MTPLPYRVVDRRVRRRADTVDARRWSRSRDGLAACVRAGPVHDAVRLRRRRGADLGQRRAGRRRRLVHTVRAVGAVTRALHAAPAGHRARRAGPFGTGWDVPPAPAATWSIVAGGIGLAPLRPVVRPRWPTARATAGVTVLIGARTPADLLYTDEYDRVARGRRRGRWSPSTAPTPAGPATSAWSPRCSARRRLRPGDGRRVTSAGPRS